MLVHSRDRILPELSESLGRYAKEKMRERGVEFRLNTRLTDARAGSVVLGDLEIPAHTLVWTAGSAPNPLTKSLPLGRTNGAQCWSIRRSRFPVTRAYGHWAIAPLWSMRRAEALSSHGSICVARSRNFGEKHSRESERPPAPSIPL